MRFLVLCKNVVIVSLSPRVMVVSSICSRMLAVGELMDLRTLSHWRVFMNGAAAVSIFSILVSRNLRMDALIVATC